MKQINLICKKIYGKELFYPNCDISRAIIICADSKSLSEREVGMLLDAGYEIKITGDRSKFERPQGDMLTDLTAVKK